jgi:hypothetical protein
MDRLLLILCNPNDHKQEIELYFQLDKTNIAKKWKYKIKEADSKNYHIDDPERFYGFYDFEKEKSIALTRINNCVDLINSHELIINRHLTNIEDIDTLNYFHHIFEEYHGLLDKQTHNFYVSANQEVRKALCDLNILVHRVESVLHKNPKRFVVTYFGLPKTEMLDTIDFDSMTCQYEFGGLYLNYVEVGKTIEDLVRDEDEYIHDDAVKPWNFFSADFTVRFNSVSREEALKNEYECKKYYDKNYDFFKKLGYPKFTNQLKPGKIKIGQLVYSNIDDVINQIKNHQYVKSVNFY